MKLSMHLHCHSRYFMEKRIASVNIYNHRVNYIDLSQFVIDLL